MTTGRIWGSGILAAAVAGAMLALSPSAMAQEKSELWTSRDTQQGGVAIVAEQLGYFREAGADVTVRFVSSGSEIPAGMAGRSIPMAIAGWTNPMAMVANGLPVRILARTADTSGAFQIVVRSDAQASDMRSLEGKKIGLTRIPLVMPLLTKACEAAGCKLDRLVLVNMQPEDIVLAFQKGNVDAVLTWEPWATYARQQGGRTLVAASDPAPNPAGPERRMDGLYAALFARSDFIDGNPKAVRAVLQGLIKAGEFMRKSPEQAAEIIGAKINIPKNVVLETMGRVETGLSLSPDWAAEFDRKAAYLVEAKELRRKTTAAEAFLPGPLKEVCAACVPQK